MKLDTTAEPLWVKTMALAKTGTKPTMQTRELWRRPPKGGPTLYFGAEIPLMATITQREFKNLSGSKEVFRLAIDHADNAPAFRKAGYVRMGYPQQRNKIGSKRIERSKIRELLGDEVVNQLPRGFKVGQKIPFSAWAWLFQHSFDPVLGMTICNPNLKVTSDAKTRRSTVQWWEHAPKTETGFLLVTHGPGRGLTVEYTAAELNQALKPTFRMAPRYS